jgi:hypothetical protein
MLTRFFSVVTVDALEGPYFRTVTFEGVRCASNDVSPLIALPAMNRIDVVRVRDLWLVHDALH